MTATPSLSKGAEQLRAYRRRLANAGRKQVVIDLSADTIAFIDKLRQLRGLPNRRLALLEVIEQGRQAAQKSI